MALVSEWEVEFQVVWELTVVRAALLCQKFPALPVGGLNRYCFAFPILKKDELDYIIVEVTILTPPVEIKIEKPEDYLSNIEIGRDGLIVEQGFYKGLLLPQVPVEQGWDKEGFISHTCMKAGLLPDAWFDKNTRIFKFSGQVFTEIKPRGEIKEKKLNGSSS